MNVPMACGDKGSFVAGMSAGDRRARDLLRLRVQQSGGVTAEPPLLDLLFQRHLPQLVHATLVGQHAVGGKEHLVLQQAVAVPHQRFPSGTRCAKVLGRDAAEFHVHVRVLPDDRYHLEYPGPAAVISHQFQFRKVTGDLVEVIHVRVVQCAVHVEADGRVDSDGQAQFLAPGIYRPEAAVRTADTDGPGLNVDAPEAALSDTKLEP